MENKLKKTVKKLSLVKILIAVIILIFLIIIIFISPIFQVKIIQIDGMEKYSQQELMSILGFSDGMNIFMIRPIYSKKILEQQRYIKSAEIDLKYPDQVTVKIKERRIRGYVPYKGTYLYIDEDGRVLNSSTTYKERCPLVEGLDFSEFQIGEILKVKNQESLEIVLKTANMMIKYESEYDSVGEIIKIDVSDPKNIHIYIRQVDFMLGDSKDYDEKIRTMLTIIKDIPEKDRGSLDIRDISKPYTWKFLT